MQVDFNNQVLLILESGDYLERVKLRSLTLLHALANHISHWESLNRISIRDVPLTYLAVRSLRLGKHVHHF
jgi:hypothetical protein